MAILAQALLPFVRGDLMALPLASAWHRHYLVLSGVMGFWKFGRWNARPRIGFRVWFSRHLPRIFATFEAIQPDPCA